MVLYLMVTSSPPTSADTIPDHDRRLRSLSASGETHPASADSGPRRITDGRRTRTCSTLDRRGLRNLRFWSSFQRPIFQAVQRRREIQQAVGREHRTGLYLLHYPPAPARIHSMQHMSAP